MLRKFAWKPILDTINDHGMPEQRKMFIDFIINECKTPIVISRYYENLDYEEKQDTWSLFVKLTQWSSILVIVLVVLLAFFLL